MFGTMKVLIPQPQICNFMSIALWAILNPPCKEQTPEGKLKDTHCTPQKCLHIDVFEWVWAWDRNEGMWIHYPAGVVQFSTAPRGWDKV